MRFVFFPATTNPSRQVTETRLLFGSENRGGTRTERETKFLSPFKSIATNASGSLHSIIVGATV